jgi:SAM-dependent methyltransferase
LQSNWFESFFEGLFVELWLGAMPPEVTAQEAEFLAERLRLSPGHRVLDAPCGGGRHAITLAGRGMEMTGIDISGEFLEHARRAEPRVEWVQTDMRSLPWELHFDAAYTWGNSFAYFDSQQCRLFLAGIARTLRPGARYVLETGAAAESIFRTLQTERRMEIGDILFESQALYDPLEARLDITYTLTRGDRREQKTVHQWVHTTAEIVRMLREAGLEPVEACGGVDGSRYQIGSPHLVLTAERRC